MILTNLLTVVTVGYQDYQVGAFNAPLGREALGRGINSLLRMGESPHCKTQTTSTIRHRNEAHKPYFDHFCQHRRRAIYFCGCCAVRRYRSWCKHIRMLFITGFSLFHRSSPETLSQACSTCLSRSEVGVIGRGRKIGRDRKTGRGRRTGRLPTTWGFLNLRHQMSHRAAVYR